MRRTPPATRSRGSQQSSPSRRGSPSIRGSSSRGSRGRGNTRAGSESAPPGFQLNQPGERSPTLSVGNHDAVGSLNDQSSPFADTDQTVRKGLENPFISTPNDLRQPPPHTRTLHPQPIRPQPVSFDDFIGESENRIESTQSEVYLRLQRLDKIATTVESFTRNMTKLDNEGINFRGWLEEVNANIYFLIGKPDYLNQPSNPSNQIHPDVDHAENTIAYRVLYYSVTPDLRTVIRREQRSFLAHDAYLILSNQFNKAGRSSQLATWRSMMNAQMDIFKTSLSQHLESLDRLADALDCDGFVWTRDSVMSLIYQASMPDKPDLNFDAANSTLDLRWSYDKRPYSSAEIRAALQTTLLNLKRHHQAEDVTDSFMALNVSKEDSICHYCNKPGHWKNECPRKRVSFAHHSSTSSSNTARPNQRQTTFPDSSRDNQKSILNDSNSNTPKSASAHAVSVDPVYEEFHPDPDGTFPGVFSSEQGYIPPSAMSVQISPEDFLAAESAARQKAQVCSHAYVARPRRSPDRSTIRVGSSASAPVPHLSLVELGATTAKLISYSSSTKFQGVALITEHQELLEIVKNVNISQNTLWVFLDPEPPGTLFLRWRALSDKLKNGRLKWAEKTVRVVYSSR
ncbi:hypothetical protein DFH28DRAFT_1111031 [Melampsora americana]|nr:hypothetical protein DFH28DRAFT_1111031 [Melampsora americana]